LSSGYALSPLAQADLSDIWDYSYSQWGADQADAYVLAIHEACEGLVTAMANGRLAGQSAEHIRTGYCKQIVGSHLVFFRCSVTGSVDVVRILNQRMDVAAHL
jgi:toxin ParE1/3/4